MTDRTRCFSTLGCPELSVEQAVALARQYQIDAIELRVISGSLDVPQALADEFGTPAQCRAFLAGHGVRIAAIGTSVRLFDDDFDTAETEPFLPWAEALGVPFLRVFDGGAQLHDADYQRAAERLGEWELGRQRRGLGVDLMIETHDALFMPDQLGRFVELVPTAKILWDTHHTWAKGGNDPLVTWAQIAPSVVHLHVKDSVMGSDGRQYVLPGQGTFPMAPLLAQLDADSARLPLSLEWERHWHKQLPPLDTALTAARGWW